MSYQGRIQLVKGWDAIFSRLEEHLNGLQSMRASPHFHAVQVHESWDCGNVALSVSRLLKNYDNVCSAHLSPTWFCENHGCNCHAFFLSNKAIGLSVMACFPPFFGRVPIPNPPPLAIPTPPVPVPCKPWLPSELAVRVRQLGMSCGRCLCASFTLQPAFLRRCSFCSIAKIIRIYIFKYMKKYTSAVRSTKNDFDQNSALQAACDTSIARVTRCVYPREGYRSVTPLLMPGSRGLRRSTLFCARKLYNPR